MMLNGGKSLRKIKAILFDMDGVLVHSEPVITEASIRSLKNWGIDASRKDFHEFTGMGEDRFIGGVAEKYGVTYEVAMKNKAYEIYLDIVNEKLGRYEATVPTLEMLKKEGYRLVLASAADRIKVIANLNAAGIDENLFCAILSGNDVIKKKPHPDIYVLAASKAGCAPENCVVVEDALSGLAAAHSAGIPCICVETSFSYNVLKNNGAEYICTDIGGIPEGIKYLTGCTERV